MEQYNLEEQKILKNFLLNFYFDNTKDKNWKFCNLIEFIAENECNKNCYYCNLILDNNNYDKKKILNNLLLILNYLIENKIFVSQFNISYNTNYYFEILDLFIQYSSNIPKNILKNFGLIKIKFFTNNFNLDIKNKINIYEEKNQKLNIKFLFSLSIEDPFLLTNDILSFFNDKNYEIRPLLTNKNINNINKIFDQYLYILENYSSIELTSFNIIKDNQWEEEQFNKYKNFIEYVFNKFLEFKYPQLINDLLILDDTIFDICKLNWNDNLNYKNIKCKIKDNLYINLINLSFPICNSLTSPQFLAGSFEIENNKIINIVTNYNLSSYIQFKTLSENFYPQCLPCIYKNICEKGCLGEQFKNSGEILLPINNICSLEQIRINKLIQLYTDSGLLDYFFKNNLIENKFFKEWLMLIKNKSFSI